MFILPTKVLMYFLNFSCSEVKCLFVVCVVFYMSSVFIYPHSMGWITIITGITFVKNIPPWGDGGGVGGGDPRFLKTPVCQSVLSWWFLSCWYFLFLFPVVICLLLVRFSPTRDRKG